MFEIKKSKRFEELAHLRAQEIFSQGETSGTIGGAFGNLIISIDQKLDNMLLTFNGKDALQGKKIYIGGQE